MRNYISEIFRKRGITSREELSKEELSQVQRWEKILSEGECTLEKVKEFCHGMVGVIETKWRDWDLSKERKAELLPYHVVYRAIISVIDGSQVERENLEKYLNQLIEN